jgi:hypothetical protein
MWNGFRFFRKNKVWVMGPYFCGCAIPISRTIQYTDWRLLVGCLPAFSSRFFIPLFPSRLCMPLFARWVRNRAIHLFRSIDHFRFTGNLVLHGMGMLNFFSPTHFSFHTWGGISTRLDFSVAIQRGQWTVGVGLARPNSSG